MGQSVSRSASQSVNYRIVVVMFFSHIVTIIIVVHRIFCCAFCMFITTNVVCRIASQCSAITEVYRISSHKQWLWVASLATIVAFWCLMRFPVISGECHRDAVADDFITAIASARNVTGKRRIAIVVFIQVLQSWPRGGNCPIAWKGIFYLLPNAICCLREEGVGVVFKSHG